MQGTLLCVVSSGDEGADVVAAGAEVSERLGLRLVLVDAVDGIDGQLVGGEGSESVSMKGARESAGRRLARLAAVQGVTHRAERRIGVGDPAALIARIAAEEAADLIVVGATTRGWRKRLESRLAFELETASSVTVLIAPPRARATRENNRSSEGATVVA